MALADFIQALQEQEVVYSEPSKSSIRVIPPEHQQSLRVLPPETSNDVKVEPHVSTSNNIQASPQKIKLKIKLKPVDSTIQPASNFVSAPTATSTEKSPVPTTSASNIKHEEKPSVKQEVRSEKPVNNPIPQDPEPISTPKVDTPPQVETIPEEPRELTDEDIFNSTGTEYSKKELWLNYFNQAKNSRKKNPIVDRMKVGRFTITPDNKVLLLPDYDIVGKDPDDVLKDKWF